MSFCDVGIVIVLLASPSRRCVSCGRRWFWLSSFLTHVIVCFCFTGWLKQFFEAFAACCHLNIFLIAINFEPWKLSYDWGSFCIWQCWYMEWTEGAAWALLFHDSDLIILNLTSQDNDGNMLRVQLTNYEPSGRFSVERRKRMGWFDARTSELFTF